MLIASFVSSYSTTNSSTEERMDMFVHQVIGSLEELKEFERVQGEHYRTDKLGNPIWHNPEYYQHVPLIILKATDTRPERVIADKSQIAIAKSLMRQYGEQSTISQAIAKAIATEVVPSHKPKQADPEPAPKQATDSDPIDNG